jgi:type IV pilus assembly protein PilF
MSARKAIYSLAALAPRGAGVAVAALGIALAMLVALGGCASHKRAEQKKDDASNYNAQLGIEYMRQGDIPLAKEKLDRALQENPANPAVHSARAMLFDRMNLPKDADSEYREALHLAPNDPDVSNNYAVYLCQIGRADDGVRRFEAVARNALYRTPWVAYTNAGVCLRRAKRAADAAKNFKQALALRPNFSEAAYQLGDLEFETGNLTDARAQIDTYLNAFEETPDLLLLGVRIARAQNDRVGIVLYGRKLRLDFPDSAQAKALAQLDHNPG